MVQLVRAMYGSRGKAAAQKVEKSFLRTRPLLILCIAALALAALPSAAAERPEEDDGGTSQGADRSFLEALTSNLLRRSEVQPRHLGHGTFGSNKGETGNGNGESPRPDQEEEVGNFSEEGDHEGEAGHEDPKEQGPAAAAGPGPEADPAADNTGEAGTQGIGEETIKIGKEMGVQAKEAQKAKAGLDLAKKEKVPPWKKSFEELNAQADELRKKAVDSLNKMKGGVQAMAQKKKEIHKSVDTVEDHFKEEEKKTTVEGYPYKTKIDEKPYPPVKDLKLDDPGTAADEDAPPFKSSRGNEGDNQSEPP